MMAYKGSSSIWLTFFPLLFVTLSGCNDIPADPGKSFENAAISGLRAGYFQNNPWVFESEGRLSGIEPEIINGFASANGFKVTWISGTEEDLMRKLEKKEIHLVVGGFLDDTPWKSRKTGFSKPYFTDKKEKRVIAIMQGENRLLFNLEKYIKIHKQEIYSEVRKNN
jgi:sRNA-binding carbon storage regulator CsrA